MRKELSRLDYFTLKVLIGLFEFKNCSVVAEKLNTTQPKVSRALSCLREVIQDELFVRQQYGLQPNLMAEKIYPLAKSVVATLEEIDQVALAQPDAIRVVNVAVQEHMSAFFLEALSEASVHLNQKVVVNVQSWCDNVSQLIAQGKLDYAITVNSTYQEMIENLELGEVRYRFVVAKKGHPIFRKPLSYSSLIENRLVFINYCQVGSKPNWFEPSAKLRGEELKLSLKTSSLTMALEQIVKSDDVCCTASIFAYQYFKNRDDTDFIDATDFCHVELSKAKKELAPEEHQKDYYYLQYHHSNEHEFTHLLSEIMKRKLDLMQDEYEQAKSLVIK